MTRIAQLIKDRDHVLSLMSAIIRDAVTSSGEERALNADEALLFHELERKAKAINEEIKKEEAKDVR